MVSGQGALQKSRLLTLLLVGEALVVAVEPLDTEHQLPEPSGYQGLSTAGQRALSNCPWACAAVTVADLAQRHVRDLLQCCRRQTDGQRKPKSIKALQAGTPKDT